MFLHKKKKVFILFSFFLVTSNIAGLFQALTSSIIKINCYTVIFTTAERYGNGRRIESLKPQKCLLEGKQL